MLAVRLGDNNLGGELLRVDLAALVYSAAHANGQGEDLAIAHAISDSRMEAAQPGWAGDSAAAMVARMDVWLATSKALLMRVGEHALGLNSDAIKFTAMEQQNAEKLRAVGDGADEASS
jgi:uncharacterized protein YukE